jgi:hypothetical protein
VALGNDRPPIVVRLEDRVLECVIAISEGKSPVTALDDFYSEALLLESDLKKNVDAMRWFNLVTVGFSIPPTPPQSVFPSTPSRGVSCNSLCSNINADLNILQGWLPLQIRR